MNLLPFLLLASAALFIKPSTGQNSLLAALLQRRYGYYRYPYSYYYPNYYPQSQGQGQGGEAPSPAENSSEEDNSSSSEDKDSSSDQDPIIPNEDPDPKPPKEPNSYEKDEDTELKKDKKGKDPKSKEEKSPKGKKDKDKGSKDKKGGSSKPRKNKNQGPKKEKDPQPKKDESLEPKKNKQEEDSKPSEEAKESESLCPPEPTMRSLSGKPVKSSGGECNFDEVASVTSLNGQTVACNAALTKAKVDGVMKTTFVTSALCASVVDELIDNPDSGLELRLGSKAFSLDKPFETKLGPNGAAFLDLPEDSPVLAGLDQCEKPSCAFKSDTMEGQVDMSQCKMISHGATDAVDFKFEGKHETALQEKPFGCSELPDLFGAANTICMENKGIGDVFCLGDSGAPVYCKAQNSKEWILVGVVAVQTICGGSSEVKVIPVPT